MARVCKKFCAASKEDCCWKQLCLQDFEIMCQDTDGNYITPRLPWKDVYKALHLIKVSECKDQSLLSKYAVNRENCPFCKTELKPVNFKETHYPMVRGVECENCHFFLFHTPCRTCEVRNIIDTLRLLKCTIRWREFYSRCEICNSSTHAKCLRLDSIRICEACGRELDELEELS